MILQNKFVEYIPGKPEYGILYVSMEHNTVLHLCPCGCGNKIVTPILPGQWTMTYNGEGITLYPSIGNWSLDCETHYWIRNSKVINIPRWTEKKRKRKVNKTWSFMKKRKE
jgi:hypothetical protein